MFLLASVALTATGCGSVGGQNFSLLSSSEVSNPLEVPPGLSPLPESEQFNVPTGTEELNIESLSPEQFRNYESWVSFEEFRKFRQTDQGFGLEPNEYRLARKYGEGYFKARPYKTASGTVRLHVVDEPDEVWKRLAVVLSDMGIEIIRADTGNQILVLKNVPVKNTPTLAQRFGFRENSEVIHELHLSPIGTDKTEVIGKSDLGVEVNYESGESFFKRLRFYMLTQYEINPDSSTLTRTAEQEEILIGKTITLDDSGNPVIEIRTPFDSTWTQVGQSLEASGLKIDDLDRNEGVYTVSYFTPKQKKYRFLFWKNKNTKTGRDTRFRVTVSKADSHSQIMIEPISGEEEDIQAASDLLNILYERLSV